MARHKGFGRLFVRGSVWYMRWRTRGIEIVRSTGISIDEPDAEKRADRMLLDITEPLRLRRRETALEIVKRQIQTVEEEIADRISGRDRDAELSNLFEIFSSSSLRPESSPERMRVYKRYCRSLETFFGSSFRIASMSLEQAQRFAASLKGLTSPNTFNKYLNGLGLIWNAVSPIVGAAENPWERIPRRKLDTHVRRTLTEDETERLLSTAKGELRSLVAIGLYTGLRLGDAVRLRHRDIHDGMVEVKTSKTGAQVAIPAHRRLLEAVGEGDADDFITPSLLAFYNTESSSVIGRVRRLFRKCGITTSVKDERGHSRPDAGFHSLRHTFVSRCIESGIPQQIVQALVGHSSAKMTDHYTHFADRTFLEQFAKLK